MSKRFYYDEFLEEIYDEQIGDYPSNQSICGILNQQAERIAELEEQLKNAIVPKFEVGQTLFRMDFGSIVPFLVNEIYVHIKEDKTISIQYFDYVGLVIEENELFAIREEAEQKLKELGEKK